MIKTEKRIWKRVTLLLLLSILIGVCGQYSQVIGEEIDFQKIRLTPTDVTWEVDNENNNETSVFSVNLNVTIYNPNSYSMNLEYPTEIIQMIGTAGTIELEENATTYLVSVCFTYCLMMEYRTINPGYTTNQSASKLTIYRDGLTNLPDGNYTLSAFLYNQNETRFVSDKLILTMKDGISTIDYSFIPSVNLGFQEVVLPLTIITIFVVYNFRRRNKK